MGKVTYSDGTTPNICIVGAGFSGLTAGIRLKAVLGLTSYTIFDENEDVGGTWLVNTYPGCACDVQSHLYSWSFEPNPNWSHTYSGRKEIWEYMKMVATKHNLYPKIKFNSQIKEIAWVEPIRKWRVTVYNKETRQTNDLIFDIVINGPGALRIPNIPKQFLSFQGPILHSGAWDNSVDLDNKIIAVVGSGSSAIQMIPELAVKAKELHCYQRKPAWVLPRKQYKIPEFVKWIFANIPFVLLIFRWLIFLNHEFGHGAFVHDSFLSRVLAWMGMRHLNKQVPEEELRNQLTPNYTAGCKRVIVSNEYYPTFQQPHVKLHREPIVEVKGNGIVTADGVSQKIDVLVLGTGFTVQDYFAPMSVTGKNSTDIMAEWKKHGPGGYLGIAASNTPNSFSLIGPNTGLGHNTILFMLECQMNYLLQVLEEMMRRDAKLVEPMKEAEAMFKEEVETQMQKMVWGKVDCGSWYADKRGIITTLWPYSCLKYWRKTRVADFNYFHFE